ncbi:MAG: DNA-binding protein, partial [Gammaproteobacteria bacterium]|nr:DNA-binding protein [Gammaproteobacteria bacterium]
MNKDLTGSHTDRQNILNNRYAIDKMEENLALVIPGSPFKGDNVYTKAQVAELLALDERTIERYLTSNGEELSRNGYRVLKEKAL